jgi:hypothetical protein
MGLASKASLLIDILRKRPCARLIWVNLALGMSLTAYLSAQDQVYPPRKPVANKLHPDMFVLDDRVVAEQWKVTHTLVNVPFNLELVEPGQCIRVGVIANGDDRDLILSSGQLGFEVDFEGSRQNFEPGLPEAVKQIKPEGGDFVSEALAAAGVKGPSLSVASIAASRAKWCVPTDAKDGTATILPTMHAANRHPLKLNARRLKVAGFSSARKDISFKDMGAFSAWMQGYHKAPNPAGLLQGLRIVASDAKARSMASINMFFIEALRANPPAARDTLDALATESHEVQNYALPLLAQAGLNTAAVVSRMREEDKAAVREVQMADPYDMTPDSTLPNRMDMLWAAYFATGDIRPVQAIVSMLAWRPDYDKFVEMQKSGEKPQELTPELMRGVVYTVAGWSLVSLSRNDGLVADYIDALKDSPDVAANVKNELAKLYTNPAFQKK